MTDEKKQQKNTKKEEVKKAKPAVASKNAPRDKKQNNQRNNNKKPQSRGSSGRPQNKRQRKSRANKSEAKEFDQKILSIRRVSRVVAGGRRFSLSVAVAIGNRRGKVGIGKGKATDTVQAIEKAAAQAKKNLINVPLTETLSIPHQVSAKYCASEVMLRPSKSFIAGGAVRQIADLAGIRNINAKIKTRSKNHINNAKATVKALSKLIT
ncbi:MAG: 30S ribosomal protein S5 [Candidatus Campbellbacteria bacterium]|nr:30S ribosomal protein S5 [Candidatus Campbellbacteria bacterium]